MTQGSIVDVIFVIALGVISTAFWLIASQNRVFYCARWFGAAFALGAFAMILQGSYSDANSWFFWRVLYGFFLISAPVAAVIGLLTHYEVAIKWKLIAGFLVVVLAANFFVQTLPAGVILERLVMHTPNVFIHAYAAYVIFSFSPGKVLDWFLVAVLVLGALFFISSPLAAGLIQVSSGEVDREALLVFDRAWTALGVVFGLSNGLLFILMFVRDMFVRTRIDGMTGLLNKKTFEDEWDVLICDLKEGEVVGCLVIADLDHFKQINDMYGHAKGDEVIKRFANLLNTCAVGDAIVGRLGGEEFGAFLPKCNLASAEKFAQAVCSAFRTEKYQIGGNALVPTASFGVAEQYAGQSAIDVFNRADRALYQAKLQGRDQICVEAKTGVNCDEYLAGEQLGPSAA